MKHTLLTIAHQLDDWAKESREGGWSTHQVEPMRKLADDLRRQHYYEEYERNKTANKTANSTGVPAEDQSGVQE